MRRLERFTEPMMNELLQRDVMFNSTSRRVHQYLTETLTADECGVHWASLQDPAHWTSAGDYTEPAGDFHRGSRLMYNIQRDKKLKNYDDCRKVVNGSILDKPLFQTQFFII